MLSTMYAIKMPRRCFGHGHEQKARMLLRYPDGALDMTIGRKQQCH